MVQSTARIRVDNVSKRPPGSPGQNRILSGISFDVFPGEVFTILGPSGAGKSTLLRLLNGLDEPETGEIYYGDVRLQEYDIFRIRKEIGMVFQQPALLPGTVEENLQYPREIHSNSGTTRSTNNSLLQRVSLSPEILPRDASTLSVGQQQRLMIARSLVNEPNVLLMDEPTSALDPTASKRILQLTRQLSGEFGLTIVYVTHNIPEARAIADRVLLLVDGTVQVVEDNDSFFTGDSGELARQFLAGELETD